MKVSKRTASFVRIWVPRLRVSDDGVVLAYFVHAYAFFPARYAHVMSTLALREINRRSRLIRRRAAGGVR